MENTFTGKITEINTPRTGTTEKGEWAKTEFEVTELNPNNENYPQVAFFDFFKNGEHVKFAKDFKTYYKLNDVVTVHFNFKKNEYTKADGTPAKFYNTAAWKIEKVEIQKAADIVDAVIEPAGDLNEDDGSDLPF